MSRAAIENHYALRQRAKDKSGRPISPMFRMRLARQWTLQYVGGMVGMDYHRVSQIERGQVAAISLHDLAKLSALFGCAPLDLFPALARRMEAVGADAEPIVNGAAPVRKKRARRKRSDRSRTDESHPDEPVSK